jgi:hypothetical protein
METTMPSGSSRRATIGEHRTTDLALAAYLNFNDYKHDRIEVIDGSRSACWVFPADRRLLLECELFNRGECTVEPRAFVLAVRETRDELYRFLKQARRR